jgi:glutamate---cysteine ligase / carboxylate-amine ligase
MDYKDSKPLTFGMELELQIIDRDTGKLSPSSGVLWRELEVLPERERFALEATQSTIEVTTSVHEDSDEMEQEARDLVAIVKGIALAKNLDLRGGGTHIQQFWNERELTSTERAHELASKYGFLPKRFSTYGMHVHVGMPGKEEAIQVANILQALCPLFISMSGASPYQQGEDTGFSSARPLESIVYPYGGPMPALSRWAEFERVTQEIFDTGLAQSLKDIYWDVRPKPEFGTVEVRVFDTPLSVKKAVMLAAFTRACAALALDHQLTLSSAPTPYGAERVSRFFACRDGINATIYNPFAGRFMTVREYLRELTERVQAAAPCAADVGRINNLLTTYSDPQDSDIMRETWLRISADKTLWQDDTPTIAAYAANTAEHCNRLLA